MADRIGWRDEVEYSHEFTEDDLTRAKRAHFGYHLNIKERTTFSLEWCAEAWATQRRDGYTTSPLVFVRDLLDRQFNRNRTSFDALHNNFWLDMLANYARDEEAGGEKKGDFDALVSERWREAPELDDESTRKALIETMLDLNMNGQLPLATQASYSKFLFLAADTILQPGAFLELVIARGLGFNDIAAIVAGLTHSSWEHKFANGEVLETLGDAFYESLSPEYVRHVLRNAPHPRAYRVHLERSKWSVGPEHILKVADKGDLDDDTVAEIAKADVYKSRGNPGANHLTAPMYASYFGISEEGLARLADVYSSSKGSRTYAMARIHAPEVAAYMHEALGLKSIADQHAKAEHWLKNEGANAIEGLVGMAQRRGKKRDFALEYLKGYVDRGHEALVRASMARAPKKIAALLEDALFNADEEVMDEQATEEESGPTLATLAPGKVLKLDDAPEWLQHICAFPEKYNAGALYTTELDWPIVRLKSNKKALSATMLERLCATLATRASFGRANTQTREGLEGLLKKQPDDVRDAVLATLEVREAILPEDAERLWFFLHARSSHTWVSHSLDLFGGDAAFTHAAALMRRDREYVNTHSDATSDQFHQDWFFTSFIHTDNKEAWRQVARLEELTTQNNQWAIFASDVKSGAKAILANPDYDEIDLAIGLAPHFGLDEHAEAAFDYGGEGKKQRVITFRVDATLQCVFEDNHGKTYRSIPSARKGEDRDAVELHKHTMKWMRSLLDRAFDGTRERLERTLRVRMDIPAGKLRHDLIRHPWQRHFLRALIWGREVDGELGETFMCDLDGTFFDENFDSVEIPDDALLNLVHPLELDEARRLAWEQVLADNELIPPFAQFERKIIPPEQWDGEKQWIKNVPQWKLSSQASRLLRCVGWRRQDTKQRGGFQGGYIWYASFPLPEHGLEAAMMVIPKQWSNMARTDHPGLYFFEEGAARAPENEVAWDEIPPRVLSELLGDVRHVFE